MGVAIQLALMARGFYPGVIDGIVGIRTKDAIRAYQRSRNEPETGELSPRQLRSLLGTP